MTHAGPVKPAAIGIENRGRVWTRAYLLLCLTHMLCFMHEGLFTGTLPLYLTSLGSTEVVIGLVIAAFSAASFLARPFLGYWVDRWSVVGVLVLGTLTLTVAGLVMVVPLLWLLVLANVVRGVGWAALNTAGNTVLAAVAPPARRGEASAYYNLFQNSSIALMPALAVWLLAFPWTTFQHLILLAGAMTSVATVLARTIRPPASAPPTIAHESAVPEYRGVSRFLDRRVLLPSLLLGSLLATHPASKPFVPVFALGMGIPLDQIAWYFVASGATSVIGRLALARLSDQVGRRRAILGGFLLVAAGLTALATATSLPMLVIGGVLYSLGDAMVIPTATALAIDLSDPRRRGAAMATYAVAFQAGVAAGAVLSGVVAEVAGFRVMYFTVVGIVGIALAMVVFGWSALLGERARS